MSIWGMSALAAALQADDSWYRCHPRTTYKTMAAVQSRCMWTRDGGGIHDWHVVNLTMVRRKLKTAFIETYSLPKVSLFIYKFSYTVAS